MSGPVAVTAQGAVRGRREGGIAVFRNIPYAAPPHGAGRFAAPEPHPPWSGVRDAALPGPNAPQGSRRLGALDMSPYFGAGWARGEDYLTVDVRAPEAADGLPVIVFVHGGGFVSGSTRSPLYDGSAFARDGVVFVALNYRLGVAGFLDLPGAPANRGLLDVIAALRWVRENIAAFGGDPERVVLAGQSAGATLVGAVLAEPAAAGLVRRAVVQSGSGLGAFSPEQAARVTAKAAGLLGVEPDVRGFAGLPDEALVEAAAGVAGTDLRTASAFDPLAGLTPFAPVLEVQPAQAVAAGSAAGVDLLIGANREEGNLYLVPDGSYAASTAADVEALATRVHPEPERLLAAYRASRPNAGAGELRSAVLGDALFGAGTRALAEAQAQQPESAVFAYEFDWRSGALDGGLGATHAVELPFVLDLAGLPGLRGPGAILGPDAPPSDLADRMHGAWLRFAADGDPGWAGYGGTRRSVMLIGAEWRPAEDPRGAELGAWPGVSPRTGTPGR